MQRVLEFVDSCVLCCGNDDERIVAVVSQKKGELMDATGWCYGQCQNLLMYIYIQYVHIYMYICMLFPPGGTCVAYLDKKHSTVRCTDCDLLVPPQPDSVAGALQCARCQHYRPALRVLISWFNRSRPREHDGTDPSSHTPFNISPHQRRIDNFSGNMS